MDPVDVLALLSIAAITLPMCHRAFSLYQFGAPQRQILGAWSSSTSNAEAVSFFADHTFEKRGFLDARGSPVAATVRGTYALVGDTTVRLEFRSPGGRWDNGRAW